MEDISASRLVPTSKILPSIHPRFPVSKSSIIDQSIENIDHCIIYPESSDLNSNIPIQFIIHDSPGFYLDLASLELEISLSLLKPNNERLAAGDKAYFIDNLLSSLFPIRKVTIAGVNVETQYAGSYLAHMKHLLESSNDCSKKLGKPRGMFELAAESNRSPINDATADLNDERQKWSKSENDVIMRGYLDLDICSLNKWLLDLTTFTLSLESGPNPFIINCDKNDTSYKKHINYIKLHVNKIRPSNGGFLSVTKSVMKDPLEYIFTRHLVHSEIIAAFQSSIILNRPWQSRIPQKIYLFMVKQTADQGMYNEDPLYFHHNKLINYRIMIDGNPLIEQACTTKDGYVNPYVNSQIAYGNGESFIPFEMYNKGGFLLIIKTNHSQNNELSFGRRGNISIILNFEDPLAVNYVVYLVGQQHSSLQITADRSCITNYTY